MMAMFWLLVDAPILAAINVSGVAVMVCTWPLMRWTDNVTLAANWASFALVVSLGGLIPYHFQKERVNMTSTGTTSSRPSHISPHMWIFVVAGKSR